MIIIYWELLCRMWYGRIGLIERGMIRNSMNWYWKLISIINYWWRMISWIKTYISFSTMSWDCLWNLDPIG